MNEELKVIISAEVGKLKKGTEDAKKAISGLGSEGEKSSAKLGGALKKIGAAIAAAFTVDAIANFTKEIVNASAEVSAEQSAFAQIMGDYSEEATAKLRKVADETGITETRLTSSMTSMTAKWKGLGYGVDEATSYASRGLTIAADASAFWDMSLDESVSHLNSFINGSYEGGEAIGLFANDTQMAMYAVESGLIKSTKEWANLDEAQKQATRLEYAENMMKASGATGQAAKEADQFANVQANLNEKWRQFQAAIGEPILQNIVLPAMEALSGAIDAASAAFEGIQGAIDSFNSGMQAASDWCSQNQIAIEILGAAFGVLTAAIVAYNIAAAIQAAGGVAQVASLAATAIGVGALTVAETVATVATTAFGAAMAFLTSPVTLVIAAIAAVIAIIVLCVRHWEEIQNVALQVWDAICSATSSAVDAVVKFFTNLGNDMSNAVKSAVDAVVGFFSGLWNGLVSIVSGIFSAVSGAFNNVKTAMGNAINTAKTTVINIFNGIKSGITTVVNGVKSTVSNVFNAIKSAISTPINAAKSTVLNVFNAIKSGISDKINAAKSVVSSAINRIKSIMDFHWELPRLKLPHISISGSFSLNPPRVPSFGISWYAKGGVFDSPTLFPFGNGRIGGLGEAGAEAIVPLEKNTKWLDKIAEKIGGNGPSQIVLEVDGKVFAKTAINSINDLTRQQGKLSLVLA